MTSALFIFFAALALGAAINVLIQRHVLYSALALIVMLTSMSALFVLLQAEFLAVINVIVYAGAILVLFVFVIMLLNLPEDEDGQPDRLRWLKFIGIPMVLILGGQIGSAVLNAPATDAAPQIEGTAAAIGGSLFTTYLLPFELTSILILIALMGAIVFAKKDL
jgi:NADH-quinone oxidoreductase subunit J